MSDTKCEKCGWRMTVVLIEKGQYFITKISRCTNIRCGYMVRSLKSK